MLQDQGIIVYRIGRNETLSDILRKFDVSIRELIECNESCNLLSLEEGQTLYIKTTESRGCGYTLQENETLLSVADKFKISVLSLLKANPNFLPNEIRQGMRIALPE